MRNSTAGAKNASWSKSSANKRGVRIAACALVVVTLALFWPARHFSFVNYDDDQYVSENPHISQGLTTDAVRWAFSADLLFDSPNADYWQPVTFLSRILDIQFFGLNPKGHHTTNLLFHAANVTLCFLIMLRLTGVFWPSFLIALFFAIHPLQVDPAAWVSARKDLLSGFFGLLAVRSYLGTYQTKKSTFAFFILSLLAKPTLFMLPVLLLLLDYWPLARLRNPDELAKRIEEKAGLLFLSAVFLAFNVFVVRSSTIAGALQSLRIQEAALSYFHYLGKFFYPAALVIRYPDPVRPPGWHMIGAWTILIYASFMFMKQRQERPFLVTGWLWFLAALAPSVGLNFENRFMYIPIVGLLTAAIWTLDREMASWKLKLAAAALLIPASLFLSREHLSHWKDSVTLFEYAETVSPNSASVQNNLADAYAQQGKLDEAIQYFKKAIQDYPDSDRLYNNLGVVLAKQGKFAEAVPYHEKAIQLRPDFAEAHSNLGIAFAMLGKHDEAIREFREAVRIYPDFLSVYRNWGTALEKIHRDDEAFRVYDLVLERNPQNAEFHNLAGVIFARQEKYEDARRHFAAAVRYDNRHAQSFANLANALVRLGKEAEAKLYYEDALRLDPARAEAHLNLGVILAKEGKRQEAIRHFEEAVRLQPDYESARRNLKSMQENQK